MNKNEKQEVAAREKAKMIAEKLDFARRLKAMQESGDLDRLAKLLSITYLMYTKTNEYAEEAVEIMECYDIVHKKVKVTVNNLAQSFNAFDKVMSDILKKGGSGDAYKAFLQLNFDNEMLGELLEAYMYNKITVKRGQYIGATLFLPEKK